MTNRQMRMPDAPCGQEPAVLEAAERDAWDDTLRAHVRTCVSCQEALDVWRYMQAEARDVARELADDEPRHPGLIWWRRRILDEQAAARRLFWPITAFSIVAAALGLLVLAGYLALATFGLDVHPFGPEGSPDVVRVIAVIAGLPLAWCLLSLIYLRRGRR